MLFIYSNFYADALNLVKYQMNILCMFKYFIVLKIDRQSNNGS